MNFIAPDILWLVMNLSHIALKALTLHRLGSLSGFGIAPNGESRLDRYSGEEEFWVSVRETGMREQEEEDEFKRTHTSQA